MEEKTFEIDDSTRECLNLKTIVVLFKILYKENDISKKEYESLINVLNRRFNFN